MAMVSTTWPHPAYRIETARLVIRCYEPADAVEVERAVSVNRDHLAVWMPWAREETSVRGYLELIRRFRGGFDFGSDFTYAIFDAMTSEQVGGSGLHPRLGPGALEIGYWIARDRIREGLATEAAGALTRVGFEVMKAERVAIHCEPGNVASAGVATKLGYTRDGVIRGYQRDNDGTRRNMVIHTLTADDYPSSAAATTAIRAFNIVGESMLTS